MLFLQINPDSCQVSKKVFGIRGIKNLMNMEIVLVSID